MQKIEAGRAWRYSRYDSRNTACTHLSGKINTPKEMWNFTCPDGRVAITVSADTNLDQKNEVVVAGLEDLYVLNGSNGKLIWSKPLTCHGRIAEISPAAAVFDINKDGGPEIMLIAGYAGAMSVSGLDGSMVWQHPTNGTTAIGFGVLGCGTTDVLQTDLGDPGRIYRLRGSDGLRLWETPMSGPAYDLPVVVDINGDDSPEIIFHNRSANDLTREECNCLDADGNLLWSTIIDPVSQPNIPDESVADVSGAPVVVADFLGNGKLQILCLTDTTLALLDENGKIIWRSPTGVWGVSRRTIRSTESALEAFSLSPRHQPNNLLQGAAVGDIDGDGLPEIVIGLWPDFNLECDVDVDGSNLKNCIRTNISPSRNSLTAFSGKSGELLWRYDSTFPCPDGQGMSAPIIADINGDGIAEVVACSGDGHIHAVRGTDGSPLWQMPLGIKDAGKVIFTDTNADTFGELIVTSGEKVTVIGPA